MIPPPAGGIGVIPVPTAASLTSSLRASRVACVQYRVPERLAALAAPHVAGRPVVVDIGCGTGLAAQRLKPMAERLVGVDVASGMLEQARVARLYDDLVKAEAISYLAGQPSSCDLVFAADMLVYLGPLEALFDAVWGALSCCERLGEPGRAAR